MFRIVLVLMAATVHAGGGRDAKSWAVVEGWGRVEDPDGDCTISLKEGKVVFVVPGGDHDLEPIVGKVNAPRILEAVDGNFSVQVKVSSSVKPVVGSFRSGTLLIWQDDMNFVRLDRAGAARGEGSFDFFCDLQVFKDGKRQIHESMRNLKDQPTHLRLERRGAKLIVSFSQEGAGKWRTFKEQKVDLPRKLKVGVAALNRTRGSFALVLEDFVIGRDAADARRPFPGAGWRELFLAP